MKENQKVIIDNIPDEVKKYIEIIQKKTDSQKWTLHREEFCAHQKNNFTEDQEYWLLNRLDLETAWFLYFAKNKKTYENRKNIQSENNITKYYTAVVEGNCTAQTITTNIAHHKNSKKMIALTEELLSSKRKSKIKWKEINVQTKIIESSKFHNSWNEYSLLLISIKKWARHQIRTHCASIGHPIVWDKLYGSNCIQTLSLRSIGCMIKEV